MPKQPQLVPFSVESSGSTLRPSQMAKLITLSLRGRPATVWRKIAFFSHHLKLVTTWSQKQSVPTKYPPDNFITQPGLSWTTSKGGMDQSFHVYVKFWLSHPNFAAKITLIRSGKVFQMFCGVPHSLSYSIWSQIVTQILRCVTHFRSNDVRSLNNPRKYVWISWW